MLQAYWDESGSVADPQSHYMGIVGLVASIESWQRFEPLWQAALTDFGLSHFHMKDFAQWRGQFADRARWSEIRRRELMSRLLDAIAAAQPRIHGGVMDLDAWRALSKEEQSFFLDAWYPCMQECIRLAAVYAQVDAEHVELIFSHHPEFWGRAKGLWKAIKESKHQPAADKLGPFSMADMRSVLPLQAADLVAYEFLKASSVLTSGNGDLRFPFKKLLEIDPRAFVANIDGDMLAWQIEGARRVLSIADADSQATSADRDDGSSHGQ